MLLVISFLLKEYPVSELQNIKLNFQKKEITQENNDNNKEKIPQVAIICIILFAFFLNFDRMSDWIMEPYLVKKFGKTMFDNYFAFWIGIFYVLTIIGYLINIILARKPKPLITYKILIICFFIFALYWFLFPFLNPTLLIIAIGSVNLIAGVVYIQYINVFFISSQKTSIKLKSTFYQILGAIYVFGSKIPIPLGLWLTNLLSKQMILFLCGIPMLICAILLNYLKKYLKF